MRADEDGIAWLLFDKKDASTNTLDDETLVELDAALDKLERDRPRGLVIRSAKAGGFVAGADIAQFRRITDVAQIEALLARGHAILDRLDRLPLPTIAVIHGYCLGGGLELALACDRRIAIDDASFAFPEVLLGLHPGLGGTVRLPRLINPVQAMTMMLTGKTERARRAKSLGLVDAVTQERHVRAAVNAVIAGEMKAARESLLGLLLNTAPARSAFASRMDRAARNPREHYPAPMH
jgi:3-hydroxyacyl-CoA dehydrogenase/enoyl-CoA hydratase/3-hydroxybutyryl-CoA epimerase